MRIRIRERTRGARAISLFLIFSPLVVLISLAACNHSEPPGASSTDAPGPSKGASTMTITITSSAFENGNPIPTKYTGEGPDLSPPLTWSGAPAQTKEFALIVDDPDAPTPEPWVHWVVYAIPGSVTSFPEGRPGASLPAQPAGMKEGVTSFGRTGYGGPMPPRGHGVHRYFFKLYALDTTLPLASGASKVALLNAIKGHVLAEGQLMGTYKR
jgi:Raf kinase inhibitor-like YbhB/YbcL family protein